MREKLIEQCERSLAYEGTGREMRFTGGDVVPLVRCANIANGVTISKIETVAKDNDVPTKWISVKDRLPEQTDPATAVLGITERGRCHIVYYFKGVTSEEFTGFYDICAKREITHWMPLPEPPKEN